MENKGKLEFDIEVLEQIHKNCEEGIINVYELSQSEKPVFLVGDEIEVLSIQTLGGKAFSWEIPIESELLGISQTDDLIQYLVKNKDNVKVPFIVIALNNNADGQLLADKIEKKIKKIRGFNIPIFKYNPYKEDISAYESFLNNRDELIKEINTVNNSSVLEMRQKSG